MRDDVSEDEEDVRLEDTQTVISAIGKVSVSISHCINILINNQLCKIIRAVRSSPQRRKAWLNEVKLSHQKADNASEDIALMLILDVKTRWSSTQKMMSKLNSFLVLK